MAGDAPPAPPRAPGGAPRPRPGGAPRPRPRTGENLGAAASAAKGGGITVGAATGDGEALSDDGVPDCLRRGGGGIATPLAVAGADAEADIDAPPPPGSGGGGRDGSLWSRGGGALICGCDGTRTGAAGALPTSGDSGGRGATGGSGAIGGGAGRLRGGGAGPVPTALSAAGFGAYKVDLAPEVRSASSVSLAGLSGARRSPPRNCRTGGPVRRARKKLGPSSLLTDDDRSGDGLSGSAPLVGVPSRAPISPRDVNDAPACCARTRSRRDGFGCALVKRACSLGNTTS